MIVGTVLVLVTALYKLLGMSVSDPAKAPVITADNVQGLSGKSPDQVVAILKAKYPGTDWGFFDVPGGSILGNRVLSFFPRGPLSATRIVSQYSNDLVPYTNGINAGIEQQVGNDITTLPHANVACVNGTAVLQSCQQGWYNADGTLANGCESQLPNCESVTHDDGLGQTFLACTARGTYTLTVAMEAASAWKAA